MEFEYLKNGMKLFTGTKDRINADSPILAAFSDVGASKKVLDLGSGNGILLLWLIDRGFKGRATAVEIREEAVELLRHTVEENGISIEVVRDDLRIYSAKEKYDVVISNPPYFSSLRGAISKDESRATARSDRNASLFDVALAAKRNLKEKGRLIFCYPARQLQQAVLALAENDFSAERMRFCRHVKGAEPWLVLIDARYRSGAELRILEDFIVSENGTPTEEMKEITSGRAPAL